MSVTILYNLRFYNPRCSKCRRALEVLVPTGDKSALGRPPEAVLESL